MFYPGDQHAAEDPVMVGVLGRTRDPLLSRTRDRTTYISLIFGKICQFFSLVLTFQTKMEILIAQDDLFVW